MSVTAIKERPILFSGEMVRAILEGRKTQTRRVIDFNRNPNRYGAARSNVYGFDGYDTVTEHRIVRIPWTKENIERLLICPYGSVGDRLWVRETWACNPYDSETRYRATDSLWDSADAGPTCWRPSIFMPRDASRISLEVTGVRVERVQDISKKDCIAEGISGLEDVHAGWHQSYAQLWDKINAKRGYGWDANPWVWVIEFKRIA